ncbi:MAG TPA: transketolase [Sneathiellales bacterium]|nr:transketolase [Sneathiellales bacterium]
MRDSVIQRLAELAVKEPRIFLITGDLGFGVLTDFAERFPNQFLNAGVAEQNMTSVAAGLALEGRIVFTYSIGNFPTLRCLEQLRNDVCYHDANVNVIAIGGGFSYGPLGMSHHATEDIGILRTLPNLKVAVPSDPWQAALVLDQIVASPGPSYLRLDKSAAGITEGRGAQFRFGVAQKVREGDHVTIIAAGGILGEVMSAADELSAQGLDCRVIDMCSIKPLDENIVIEAAQETGGIVTVEEHNVIGGLGSAVAEVCLEQGVQPKIFRRIGMKDIYSELVGSQTYLRSRYGMDQIAIVETVVSALKVA